MCRQKHTLFHALRMKAPNRIKKKKPEQKPLSSNNDSRKSLPHHHQYNSVHSSVAQTDPNDMHKKREIYMC